MMTGKVRQIPCDRRIRTPEYFGAVDERDIVELGAPDPLRLQDPEQASVMQITLGLRRQAPQFFRTRRTIAKPWKERVSALDHGRESLIVHVRACRLACTWFSTKTRHVPFLAVSAAAPRPDPVDQNRQRCLSFVRWTGNPLDRPKLLGDCYRVNKQLRRGRRSPSIEINGWETDWDE
jgi:hypothetical protein